MKKKELLIPLLLSVCVLPLQSCSIFELFPGYTSESTGKSSGYAVYGTPKYGADDSADNLTLENIGKGQGYRYMKSTGDRKILVVPVQTSDYPFTTSDLTLMENGFFGTADQTGWQSVSSFYKESSYGKLNITGEVSSVVKLNMTSAQLAQSFETYQNKNLNYTDNVLSMALSALEKEGTTDLSEYDTDSDGYIDAVWMVYSVPYDSDSTVFWAYTTWADSDGKSYDGKKACLYSWGSVSFLTEKDYSSFGNRTAIADAHTFIHETGHMLGLDDYYSYDYDYVSAMNYTNADTPVGGVDMMDFNVGDHCSFSKYLMGWATPTVLTPELVSENGGSFTLPSFTETGTSYLIPAVKDDVVDYNNLVYDEYLLVEYYTPTELNEADTSAYKNGMSTYSLPGVVVYHVNASIGKLIVSLRGTASWDGKVYSKVPAMNSSWGSSYAYTFIYSNTRSYSWDTTFAKDDSHFYRGMLISLLPSTGNKIQGAKTGYATNKSLFRKGSVFGQSGTYSDFVFDDNAVPEFGFKVESTSYSSCTLSISDF